MLRKNKVDKDIIKNLYESAVNEAFNPENEEKNKVIRQALRGPKSFEKNRQALKDMGIKATRSDEYGYEPGETIHIEGPNRKGLSVDPDGTNVWHTDSRNHYKKELEYKNRHSKHYTGWDTMDFNGDRAKSFDYYNYLTKPENEYQNEVDKANKIKNYRDNEGKKGYNLPDEALTPEEKSLNRRARKYLNLKKDREELEDKLAGYEEDRKNLDKINKEIQGLHEEESIKKSNKAEYTLIPANEFRIKELEDGSAFTWEGFDISPKNLEAVVKFFKKNTPSIKLPVEFYTWKGSTMNNMYNLTGNNAYPDDLNFVSIALDNWDGLGTLPFIKFQVGARWLDDIVDNNARREG